MDKSICLLFFNGRLDTFNPQTYDVAVETFSTSVFWNTRIIATTSKICTRAYSIFPYEKTSLYTPQPPTHYRSNGAIWALGLSVIHFLD